MTIYELRNSVWYEPKSYKDLPNNTTVKVKVRLYVDNDEYTFRTSTQRIGTNRHSGKQWSRWSTSAVDKIKRGKRAQMVPISASTGRSGLKFYGGWHAWNEFRNRLNGVARWNDIPEEVSPILEEIEQKTAFTIENFPLRAATGLHTKPLRSFDLLQREPADLTRTLFGDSRYRKDLVKAVAESDIAMTMLTSTMRDKVPADWIIGFLREKPIGSGLSDPLEFRRFARQMDQRTLRRLLHDTETFGARELQDAIKFLPDDRIVGNVRKWSDLHDQIHQRRNYRPLDWTSRAPVEPPKPEPIETTFWGRRIAKAFEDTGYVHVSPESTDTLTEWSNYMGNCISGYRHLAVNGSVSLGAIYHDGKLLANYEVSATGHLKQLLGRFNKGLDKQHVDALESIFKKALVNVVDYWGKPGDIPFPNGGVLDVPAAGVHPEPGEFLRPPLVDNDEGNW